MHRELGFAFCRRNASRPQFNYKVFKVVAITSIHLHRLRHHLSPGEGDDAAVGKWHTVNIHPCPMGVAEVVHLQLELDGCCGTRTCRRLHLVGQIDCEHSGSVGWDIAPLVDIDVHFGILQFERACRDGHWGYVIMGAVGQLARTFRGTALQIIYQRAIKIIAVIIVTSTFNKITRLRRPNVERIVRLVFLDAENRYIHIAVGIGHERETYGTGMCGSFGGVSTPVEVQNRGNTEINMAACPAADETDGVIPLLAVMAATLHLIVLVYHQVPHCLAKPSSNFKQIRRPNAEAGIIHIHVVGIAVRVIVRHVD